MMSYPSYSSIPLVSSTVKGRTKPSALTNRNGNEPIDKRKKSLAVLKRLCDEIGTNTLHTLTDGFRFDDTKASHIAGMRHMWSAANLHRVIPNLVDFDQVTVALTEEGQRPLIKRLL